MSSTGRSSPRSTTTYLLGGPLALPAQVRDQPAATGVPEQRLWGETALDTSLGINRATIDSAEQVLLVTEAE